MAGRWRIPAAVDDLTTSLMVGAIAGGSVAALVLFEKAPSREIAGQVGQAVFDRLGVLVLALALASLVCLIARGVASRGAGPAPSPAGGIQVWLAGAAVLLASAIALWLTPAMAEIWATASHAEDGTGLTGQDKSRFMTFHGIANLCYLAIFLLGSTRIVMRAAGRSGT